MKPLMTQKMDVNGSDAQAMFNQEDTQRTRMNATTARQNDIQSDIHKSTDLC